MKKNVWIWPQSQRPQMQFEIISELKVTAYAIL